ncbi:hypothetical protein BJV82DRAFT_637677 [Fennellomyces sp. T-0311]|nr:hypothetical protein BJV82DRAFT_637677 [Fennellomyces sp. T-0311]
MLKQFVRPLASRQQRFMSSTSHMHDNDPKVIQEEQEKQKKKGNSEWNEKLASSSEAAVKADQEHDRPVKDLQEETKQKLKNNQ